MSNGTMALTVALLLACVTPALAAKSKPICSAEIEQFCKDVQSGEGRILDCLIQHSDQLSATPAGRTSIRQTSSAPASTT